MTITTLEPATIEHLDFDPACETAYCAFGRPRATHILILPCPCKEKLACTPCTEHSKEVFRQAVQEDRKLRCNHCGRQFQPHQFQIEPLP